MPTPQPLSAHAALTASLMTISLPPRMLRAFARTSTRKNLQRLCTLYVIGGLSVLMAFILMNTLLLVYFWETHRLSILSGLTGFYALIGMLCLRVASVRASQPQLRMDLCELVKAWQVVTPAPQWVGD